MKRECWASRLGSCSDDLSREHVVSQKVVEALGTKHIEINGKRIGHNSYALKYMCRKHNSALSMYDQEAVRLVKALKFFRNSRGGENAGDLIVKQISGLLLEKWLAKTYFNMSVARELSLSNIAERETAISQTLLVDLCFGHDKITVPQGLYILNPGTNLFHFKNYQNRISFQIIDSKAAIIKKDLGYKRLPEFNLPCFFYCSIMGLELVLDFNLSPFPNDLRDRMTQNIIKNESWYSNSCYRPNCFIDYEVSGKKIGRIHLNW